MYKIIFDAICIFHKIILIFSDYEPTDLCQNVLQQKMSIIKRILNLIFHKKKAEKIKNFYSKMFAGVLFGI